jgi:pimeloyl-ACP methyl ester carboxylesterase
MSQGKRGFLFTVLCLFLLTLVMGVNGETKKRRGRSYDVDGVYNEIRNAPLMYEYTERNIEFYNEGMRLEGSLMAPKISKKCPIVITINGFIGDRHEEPIPGAGETVYQRLCKILAGHGIASLRLDCRGYGASDGEFNMVHFSSQVSDVLAAVEFISRSLRREVDFKSIGILGFSQGGLVTSVSASKEERVDSIVLWSPPAAPPITYEGLLTKQGILQGLALAEGESIDLGLYLDGVYLEWDVNLGRNFFQDLFLINPVAAIKDYENPMMVVSGLKDNIVWPQPHQSQIFLDNHDGPEKLVQIDADHEFDYWDGPDAVKLTDAIYWSVAWFVATLK